MHQELRELYLDDLIASPHNVRRDLGDLTELTASIKVMGVVSPIVVRRKGRKYEVIVGSRRVQAAREAGLATIPAIVVEVTDSQAHRMSLIENKHHKDLTLSERVEAYKELLTLNPSYTYQTLAEDIGVSRQKISQDFQALEMATKLEPYGITVVSSDLTPSADERQQGVVLPEYHAVLLHQALPYLAEDAAGTGAATEEKLVAQAHKIAAMSQSAAKAYIQAVKDGRDVLDDIASQQKGGKVTPTKRKSSQQHPVSPQPNPDEIWEKDGGMVTCEYCEQELKLIHVSDNTHQLIQQPLHPKDQQALPGLFP
jgi:ParB/RepB/Spo0J family partition protein